MNVEQKRNVAAGLCVLAFLAAQAFQELAYSFWIPPDQNALGELQAYLLPVDRTRALLVGGTILLLLVPFTVIALRYSKVVPAIALLGLIFGAAFVGFEITQRSIEFFVVGAKWAREFQNTSLARREIIMIHFLLWKDISLGLVFPLRLSILLASCCFLAATWTERHKGVMYLLAPLAFALNAVRLLARLLSTYAAQGRLDGFNGKLYFPAQLVINTLLALWFFHLALHDRDSLAKVPHSEV